MLYDFMFNSMILRRNIVGFSQLRGNTAITCAPRRGPKGASNDSTVFRVPVPPLGIITRSEKGTT